MLPLVDVPTCSDAYAKLCGLEVNSDSSEDAAAANNTTEVTSGALGSSARSRGSLALALVSVILAALASRLA